MVFSGGLVLGLHTLMTLLSPQEAEAIKGECWGRLGEERRCSASAYAQDSTEHELFLPPLVYGQLLLLRDPDPSHSVVSILDLRYRCSLVQRCQCQAQVQVPAQFCLPFWDPNLHATAQHPDFSTTSWLGVCPFKSGSVAVYITRSAVNCLSVFIPHWTRGTCVVGSTAGSSLFPLALALCWAHSSLSMTVEQIIS